MFEDYNKIIKFFGVERKSAPQLVFYITATYPNFNKDNLLSVFKNIAKSYHTSDDRIKKDIKFNKLQFRQNLSYNYSSYHSLIILQNLYEVLFESNYWDELILNPDFITDFYNFINTLSPESYTNSVRTKYWNESQLDRFEVFNEFGDKLKEKIQLYAGI